MIQIKKIAQNILFDYSLDNYPTRLSGVLTGFESTENSSTFYLFCQKGKFELASQGRPAQFLAPGMFAACADPFELKGKGEAIAIERKGYRGLFQVGGPVEKKGRLSYIDNSRASLLTHPSRLGDPCLNLLTFPPDITQTEHTHPTLRMGIVFSGSGSCRFDGGQALRLTPGAVFAIEDGMPHYFQSGKNGLSVIAFHPDSDWGPTDQNHPMLNRTYIGR